MTPSKMFPMIADLVIDASFKLHGMKSLPTVGTRLSWLDFKRRGFDHTMFSIVVNRSINDL